VPVVSPSRPHELLVLRHGKASADPRWASDFERPLEPRGEQDARAVGHWLARQGLTPDRVLSSTAARAAATARTVQAALGEHAPVIDWDDELYLAPVALLLGRLAQLPEDCGRALLVGHNPGLEELVGRLVRPGADPLGVDIGFPTCGIAQLRFDGSWAGLRLGCAELVQLRHPAELTPDA